jgi:hypothetical protein
MNDPAVLRKMVADLEQENKKLKLEAEKGMTNQFSNTFSMGSGTAQGSRGATNQQDKNWM